MYAIVRISGKQYKVSKHDVITVSKVDGKPGDTLTFTDVLLLQTDKDTTVGKPTVANARVAATVLEQGKGEKIEVRRFKSKVRYRRHTGFRPHISKLQITGIGLQ